MGSIKYGAQQAIKSCIRLKKDETVVIITDKETLKIGKALMHEALKISSNVKLFIMEDFGKRDSSGKNPLKFPKELGQELSKANVSIYAAQGKKGELHSFRTGMLKVIEKFKIRHAHMIGINEKIMKTGMSVDYTHVDKLGRKLQKIVSKAKSIRVTTPAGTDFTVLFNPNYKWLIGLGVLDKNDWHNLPTGEIFTCIGNIPTGKIVVDGVLGDFFSNKYGVLDKNPVTLHVVNGRVVKIECKNKKLLKDLILYSKQDKNANRIGEFAIGFNIGLKKLIGNLLQDEKFPGVHVSMGHGYPEKTGSNWNSKAHVDGVLKKTTIEVDGKLIMKRGKFLI